MPEYGYDTLYREWLKAKQAGDYTLSDEIRDRFEFLHGLTIIAEGQVANIDETVSRMTYTAWLRKFWGKPEVKELYAGKGIDNLDKMIEAVNANNSLHGSSGANSTLMSYGWVDECRGGG